MHSRNNVKDVEYTITGINNTSVQYHNRKAATEGTITKIAPKIGLPTTGDADILSFSVTVGGASLNKATDVFMVDAFEYFEDKNIEEYDRRNDLVLQRYHADNMDLVRTYDKLIENLFKGGNKGLKYDPKTNLYKNLK